MKEVAWKATAGLLLLPVLLDHRSMENSSGRVDAFPSSSLIWKTCLASPINSIEAFLLCEAGLVWPICFTSVCNTFLLSYRESVIAGSCICYNPTLHCVLLVSSCESFLINVIWYNSIFSIFTEECACTMVILSSISPLWLNLIIIDNINVYISNMYQHFNIEWQMLLILCACSTMCTYH